MTYDVFDRFETLLANEEAFAVTQNVEVFDAAAVPTITTTNIKSYKVTSYIKHTTVLHYEIK